MDRIVLASGSPRRKEMLEKYNIEPIVVKSNVKEIINENEVPEQIAMSLALSKALDVSQNYREDIVIGADTIVLVDKMILGKPNSEEDAFKMLSILSGRVHEVVTGIAILQGSRKIIDYEMTKVKFRELTKDMINTYISTKEPFDKAGSYGIQGLGAILVENIDGCYSNVVGLPLTKIDKILNRYFDYKILK